MIYHIAHQQDWQKAQQQGFYSCESIALEGFIHASFKEEVLNSYNNYFKPEQKLVLLFIDETKVTEKLIVEKAPSNGKDYPHIYGNLNLNAVLKAEVISSQFELTALLNN